MTPPPRALHGSLDELLAPEVLGRLEGRTVTSVDSRPFTPPHGGVSGNPLLAVETAGAGGQPRRYIVKRTSPAWDLIMRLSGDASCREMLVWRHGLLDRLPPEVGHTIVACASDGDGWALVMHDIGHLMHPSQRWPEPGWAPLSARALAVFLDGLAALHARYWQDPALLDPKLGLCELPRLYASFSPAAVQREAGGPHGLVAILLDGWQQFEHEAAPDVVRVVRGLHADSRPLCAALWRYPWTLAHADPNCKNFGLELDPNPRLLLLDWQLVTRSPPAVDLAYFLSLFSAVLPAPYEEVVDRYRDRLAARLGGRFDERWWRPQLELGLLGQLVRFGGLLAWRMTRHADPAVREHYRGLLAWWSDRARAGAALL